MMEHEGFLEGQKIDLSKELSTLMTYQIDDVKEFAYRNINRSLTVVLPGTQRNNKSFGHIYDVKQSSTYNPSLKNFGTNYNSAVGARIIILQNRIQVFKGIMRMTKIISYKGELEYEVSLLGEFGGLVLKLGNEKLETLDFSAYNQSYSLANIINSWDNCGSGSGVVFGHLDYGTYSVNKHDWSYKTFRPGLFAKEYFEKIFSEAGYTFDFTLIDTPRFKSIIIPHNQKQLTKNSSTQLNVSYNDVVGQLMQTPDVGIVYEMPISTSLGTFTTSDNKTFTYTGANQTGLIITVRVRGEYYSDTDLNLWFAIDAPGAYGTVTYYLGSTPSLVEVGFDRVYTFTINLTTGNNIRFTAGVNDTSLNYLLRVFEINFLMGTASSQQVPINLNEDISMNECIPRNYSRIDFVRWFIRLFNLYVFEDRFIENHLIVKPHPDFYDYDASTFQDWSRKLNRDKKIELTPMSEVSARYYEFTYKSDSDYYNEQYKKRYNENYGNYIFDSQFQFANETDKAEIGFSGTPLVGYVGEDKVYSTIFKLSGTTEETIDSNIRILIAKKVTGVVSWDILNGVTVLGSYTNYCYIGHFDDPDAPANDLNFGVPKELFFALSSGAINVNQFNVYWSQYMAEITDKDSKMFIGTFFLSERDIETLDFSKFKWIDGALFRLNKIEDYNTSRRDECKVELLKVINTYYV